MAGVAAKVSVWCGGIIWQWRSCSCVDRGECRFGGGLLLVSWVLVTDRGIAGIL